MLYCKDCQEKNGLPERAFQLFYETCELCGKLCTTCFFDSQTEEVAECKEDEKENQSKPKTSLEPTENAENILDSSAMSVLCVLRN